jgi:hypothetical protein
LTVSVLAESYITARERLSDFVVDMANVTKKELGFSWVATPNAPDNYPALIDAYQHSVMTGEPLPVSSLHCDNVIYSGVFTNMEMRFWHDVHHVRLGLSFNGQDELELGLWHSTQMRNAGFAPDSLEVQMLEIDMLGQNYLQAIAKKFPENQKVFVENCLRLGLHEGVLQEAKL